MDVPALESWPSRKPKRPGAMMDGLQPEISFHRWVAHSGRLNRRLRVCSSGRKALQRDWPLTWLVLGEGRQDSTYRREALDESVMPGQKFPPESKLWWIWDPNSKRPASLGPEQIQQEAEAGSVRQSNTEANRNHNLEFGVRRGDGLVWFLVPPASQDACKTADSRTWQISELWVGA